MRRTLAALVLLTAGCSTYEERQGRTRQEAGGYLELRQVVPNAKVQAVLTVDSLLRLVDQAKVALGPAFESFRLEVKTLDESAARVRARATQLRARRDATLKAWETETGSAAHRQAIQQQLAVLQARTEASRDAFAPLNAALHDCLTLLEQDLTADAAVSLFDEARRIVKMRDALTAALDGVVVALDELQEVLRAAGVKKP